MPRLDHAAQVAVWGAEPRRAEVHDPAVRIERPGVRSRPLAELETEDRAQGWEGSYHALSVRGAAVRNRGQVAICLRQLARLPPSERLAERYEPADDGAPAPARVVLVPAPRRFFRASRDQGQAGRKLATGAMGSLTYGR